MKIYLAGKIDKNDWRHEVVGDLRGAIDYGGELADWPVLRGAVFGRHDYVGPYFLSDDHGCGHGPNTHGQALGADGCFLDLPNGREAFVLAQCERAIRAAALVFAWLDDPTAYGTLAEIGFAYALRKFIYVASPQPMPELWFAFQMASFVTINAAGPAEALRLFVDRPFWLAATPYAEALK